MWFAEGEGPERDWKPSFHYRKALEAGSPTFRVKIALLIQNPRVGVSGSWSAALGRNHPPPGQTSDPLRGLEDLAWPFCLCLLRSLGHWRTVPVAFSCLVQGREGSPRSDLPKPEECGSVSRAYVSGVLRGTQLTCLTVPSGPASSKDGSSPNMTGRGLFGMVPPGPPPGAGEPLCLSWPARSTLRAGKRMSFGGLDEEGVGRGGEQPKQKDFCLHGSAGLLGISVQPGLQKAARPPGC